MSITYCGHFYYLWTVIDCRSPTPQTLRLWKQFWNCFCLPKQKKLYTRNNLQTQSNICVSLQLVPLLGTGGVYLKNLLCSFQSECIEKVSVESSGTNGIPIPHSHPKTQSHHGRESGKPDSRESHNVFKGMTGTLNSWAHSSCGCLHEACTRSRQSTVRHGNFTPSWRVIGSWGLLGKGVSFL